MDEEQKLKMVERFMYLQTSVDQRFYQFITETLMKNELTKDDLEKFKETINYVLDDQIGFIERNLKK